MDKNSRKEPLNDRANAPQDDDQIIELTDLLQTPSAEDDTIIELTSMAQPPPDKPQAMGESSEETQVASDGLILNLNDSPPEQQFVQPEPIELTDVELPKLPPEASLELKDEFEFPELEAGLELSEGMEFPEQEESLELKEKVEFPEQAESLELKDEFESFPRPADDKGDIELDDDLDSPLFNEDGEPIDLDDESLLDDASLAGLTDIEKDPLDLIDDPFQASEAHDFELIDSDLDFPLEDDLVESMGIKLKTDDIDVKSSAAPSETESAHISREQIESIVLQTLQKELSEKIEGIVVDMIEKALSKEIEKLKRLILDEVKSQD